MRFKKKAIALKVHPHAVLKQRHRSSLCLIAVAVLALYNFFRDFPLECAAAACARKSHPANTITFLYY